LFCIAIGLMLLFSGCQENNIKCLVIMPSSLDANYSAIETAANQWANDHKVNLTIAAPSLPSASQQQQVLEQYLDKEWDIICIEPLEETGLSPLLEYSRDKGTVVISIKNVLGCADYSIKPFSNEELGKKMMESLSELTDGHGMYFTMASSVNDLDTQQIEAAAVEQQKLNYADMFAASRLEQSEGQLKQAEQLVDKAFNDFQINGVLFFSTQDGLGVSSWQLKKNENISAVGLGDKGLLADELKRGLIDRLYYWDSENLLLSSLQIGYMAASSENFKPGDTISLPYKGYETLRHTTGNVWQGQDIQTAGSN
jgi:ABC-type sugar transport system substrate-binding protein